MNASGTVVVGSAREDEARACRMLLPAAHRDPEPEVLVARGPGGAILGAAALQWQGWRTPPGFPLLVEVVPSARRRGVGRALVEAAAALATGEAPGLWAWDLLAEASKAARFLAACGFAPRTRVRDYRVEVAAAASVASAVVARLRERGRVPPGARVVPLREADLAAVARLVTWELGTAPTDLRARLAAGTAEFNLDHSLALLAGSHLAGAVLIRWEAEPVADAIVVAPAYRGGWANALMLDAITALGRAVGATHFRFIAEQGVRDTVKLASRAGGEVIEERVGYYRALA